MNSLLLTEDSTVIFTIDTSIAKAFLKDEQATLVPTVTPGYTGTITWELETDENNTINESKVTLGLKNITIPAVITPYETPTSASGNVSGSQIQNLKMNNKVPMCEKDSGSFNGSCYYIDSYDVTHTQRYTCTCIFIANQVVTKGYVPDPTPEP